MRSEHEQVQEALAGYALHTLDDDHLKEVEALLASHLPTCPDCREALAGFQVVAGELGLASAARRPPRSVAARIAREVRSLSRSRWAPAAAAAAIVVATGLTLWTAHLTGRVSRAEARAVKTTEVLTTVSHPEARTVTLADPAGSSSNRLAATYIPGRPELYVFGSLPNPGSNHVYQLWLEHSGKFLSGGTFVPDGGQVIIKVGVDARSYDGLLITEEPDRGSRSPSAHQVVTAPLESRAAPENPAP
jgi:hypothetical protein